MTVHFIKRILYLSVPSFRCKLQNFSGLISK